MSFIRFCLAAVLAFFIFKAPFTKVVIAVSAGFKAAVTEVVLTVVAAGDRDSFQAALLDFVPVEELVDVGGFRIEVRFNRVGQRKTELVDREAGFAGGDGNGDVEFSLGHGGIPFVRGKRAHTGSAQGINKRTVEDGAA